MVNEYYSNELKRKITEGNKITVSKGQSLGKFHLGYKVENKKYVIDKETAHFVKRIFEMYAFESATIIDLINYLNNNGIKNSRGNNYKRHSVTDILSNDFYIGIYRSGDNVVNDVIPKLIDDNLFFKVQERLIQNKKQPAKKYSNVKGAEFLLTSKLYCECGATMSGYSGKSKQFDIIDGAKVHRTHYYYKCRNKNKGCEYNSRYIKKRTLRKQSFRNW